MVNSTAAQQYLQMKQQAQARRVLNVDAPQVQRVRAIAQRIIPFGARVNPRSAQWAWEVNVIDAPQINAFCMPGGKIMVFDGLIDTLKLNDDELAAVIGHEIAHALLEHGRARMSEQLLQSVGINLAAAYFGLGDLGAQALARRRSWRSRCRTPAATRPTPTCLAWTCRPALASIRARQSACGARWPPQAAASRRSSCPPIPATRSASARSSVHCRG